MNTVATERLNCLLSSTISDLMFAKLNGPSLKEFDPLPFVRSRLAAGKKLLTAS
jgi:hypothetical protein